MASANNSTTSSEAASTSHPDPVGSALPKRRPGRPRHDEPSPAYLARQREIVDAAVEVFRQRGYEQGTLDDVAAELGTGRASLYHYVPSTAHLLYLIFDRAITSTVARMEALATIGEPAERLRRLMRELIGRPQVVRPRTRQPRRVRRRLRTARLRGDELNEVLDRPSGRAGSRS